MSTRRYKRLVAYLTRFSWFRSSPVIISLRIKAEGVLFLQSNVGRPLEPKPLVQYVVGVALLCCLQTLRNVMLQVRLSIEAGFDDFQLLSGMCHDQTELHDKERLKFPEVV